MLLWLGLLLLLVVAVLLLLRLLLLLVLLLLLFLTHIPHRAPAAPERNIWYSEIE